MTGRDLVIGRIVHYVDEENVYEIPAMVVGTEDSSHDEDLLPDEDTVHLALFDPYTANDARSREYRFDVEHQRNNRPGTYHWADECKFNQL